MPNQFVHRIASLREVIEAGLHVENLDRLVAGCNTLAQDTSCVLPFFVLKQVFCEMSEALEEGPAEVGRYRDLTSEVADCSLKLLDQLSESGRVEIADLEQIVRIHLRNLNVFRSD